MRVAGIYSFKGGKQALEANFATELEEIKQVIAAIDATSHKTKISQEKTMSGRMLYKPNSLNRAFKQEFSLRGWRNHKVLCEYPAGFYTSE